MDKEILDLYWQRRKNELSCKSASTVRTYLSRWAAQWEDTEIAAVTPGMVESYRQLRAAGVPGSAGLNREGRELRGFFAFAEELGACKENPARIWKRQREVVARNYVVLTREEEEALVNALESDVLCRFIRFCVATGLRQGTVRQLNWGHVKGSVLQVPGKLMKQKNPVEIPLSTKAMRAIACRFEIVDPCAAEGRSRRSLSRSSTRQDTSAGGLKLAHQTGEPGSSPGRQGSALFPGLPSESIVRHSLKAAARAVGLPPDLTIHDLRRTWVARMRDAGADMSDVMGLGGWKGPTVMLKHYFGQVPERRARQFLEAI